jgi:glycine cleavage system H protein
MSIPTTCRYAKTHEWAKKEGEALVVGITDFAQHELGDIVFVDVPPAGSKFKTGEAFGAIESVKAASDLYMPVGGEITAVNEALVAQPELVNKDPHGDGWIMKIKPGNVADLDKLMDAAAYGAYIASEAAHH